MLYVSCMDRDAHHRLYNNLILLHYKLDWNSNPMCEVHHHAPLILQIHYTAQLQPRESSK